jgi:hypothetical protein
VLDIFVCMCWIYAGCVVVPRLLAAWFDLEGSRGAGGSPGLPLACQAHLGGPGARVEKPGREHKQ